MTPEGIRALGGLFLSFSLSLEGRGQGEGGKGGPMAETPALRVVTAATSDGVRLQRACFRAHAPYDAHHADTVVVRCSDGRFAESAEELVKNFLRAPSADELELPGGPAGLHTLSSTRYADYEVLWGKVRMLAEVHHTARFVIISHAGCAHYAGKYAGRAPVEIERTQLSDLVIVGQELKRRFPDAEVRAFFARPEEGKVVFDEVIL